MKTFTREIRGSVSRDMANVNARAISITADPDSGAAVIVSDVPGATVQVSEGEDGAVLLTELLEDGTTGEQVQVDLVIVPPAEDDGSAKQTGGDPVFFVEE